MPASVSRPSATRNDPDSKAPAVDASQQRSNASRRLSARRTVDGLDRRVEAGDRRQVDDNLARRVTPCGTAPVPVPSPSDYSRPRATPSDGVSSVQLPVPVPVGPKLCPNHSRAPITKAWPSSATLKSHDFPSFGLTRRVCGFRATAHGGAIARVGYEPPSHASRFDAADRRAFWQRHGAVLRAYNFGGCVRKDLQLA